MSLRSIRFLGKRGGRLFHANVKSKGTKPIETKPAGGPKENPPSFKKEQSSGSSGKFAILLALAAPPAYVLYQTRNDAEFRETFRSNFPQVYESIGKLVIEKEPVKVDGHDPIALKQEIEELARKWEMLKPVSVTFPKEEVQAIETQIESVSVPQAEVKESVSQPIETTSVEPEVEAAPIIVSPGREKIDQLKAKARGVKHRADEDAAAKIKQIEAELRKDLESVLAKDLGDLDEEGLRRRVIQLVLELRDRNRWEALRLHELTKKHTEDLVDKYEELLSEQATKYEELIRFEAAEASTRATEESQKQAEEHLHRVVQNKEQQWYRTAQEQLDRQRAEMGKEMEHRFNTAKTNLQNQAAAELAARADVLENLKEKVQTLQNQLTKRSQDDSISKDLNKIAVATLDLQLSIDKDPKSMYTALKTLESSAGKDKVVKAALDSISPRVQKNGVASLIELQHRFENVHESCHRIALVPEEGGILQHAGAAIVSKLTLRTNKSGVENDDTAEGHLFRARHLLLERNDLEGAVKEMDKLQGAVKDTASDWLLQAKDRVAVEKAVSLIKNHVSYTAGKIA